MRKTALVISGGGSKGAYATGVVRRLAMEQPDLSFDILVGTSTGALMIPLIALDELDLLAEIYTSVSNDDIYRKGNLGERLTSDNSLFDGKPLATLVTRHLTNERCDLLLRSTRELYLATTCLQTGEAVYFSNQARELATTWPVKQMENADQLRRAVLASANQPVFLPPMEIKKGATPLRQYVDGGVREYAGLQLAIDAGAEDIYVILLNTVSAEPEERAYGDVLSILLRTIDILLKDVGEHDLRIPALYNRALRYLDAARSRMREAGVSDSDMRHFFGDETESLFNRAPVRIHLIRPSQTLEGGPGGLEFNPASMARMMRQGEQDLSLYLVSAQSRPGGNV